MKVAQVIALVTTAFVGVDAACYSGNEKCQNNVVAVGFPYSFKCDSIGDKPNCDTQCTSTGEVGKPGTNENWYTKCCTSKCDGQGSG
ncbi:hypothetical protein HYFRA_00011280 [Hymenoscyphus fraxineus]|uniref:Small secreted protein n=1 Tax=Hymenoscyphus fraxineus TaxID=746836 RepID=A0A9N9PU67_9HELO|nr:hypothetical protein HYFRA_00011280 [Hymenoscyphus fraxineus]